MKRLSLSTLTERWLLPALITPLTLVDAVLHLRLDYLLFGGSVWGSASPGGHLAGPPAGAPPPGAGGPPPGGGGGNPFPLPLNEMFFLNFLAAIALVAVFWIAWRWLRAWLWLVDGALAAFAAFSIYGWWKVGEPNPQQLGYISKGLEAALILIVAAHAWLLVKRLGVRGVAAPVFRLRSAVR